MSRSSLPVAVSEQHRRARRAGAVALRVALLVAGVSLGWLGQRDGSLQPWQPLAGAAGTALVAVAAFRLPLALAAPLIARLGRLPWFATGPGSVAVASLASDKKRTGSTTAAVAATVGLAAALGGVVPALGIAATDIAEAATADRVYVSTLDPNNTDSIDDKLSPAAIAQLAARPGVAGVERVYAGSIEHPDYGYIQLAGGDGRPAEYRVLRGVEQADAIRRGGVMIGPGLARDLDLEPGDEVTVPGRSGPVTFSVGGIWAAPDGVGRSITMTDQQLFAVTGRQPPNWVLLVPESGRSATALAAELRRDPSTRNLVVLDPAEQAANYARDFVSFMDLFWALQRGLLVTAFVATLSTLLLSALQRRREHGLLGAIGMPPADLARMTVTEGALVGLAATILGGLGGLLMLVMFTWQSAVTTGLELGLHPDLTPLLVAGLVATLVTIAGSAFPAWRVSRIDPVSALRYE